MMPRRVTSKAITKKLASDDCTSKDIGRFILFTQQGWTTDKISETEQVSKEEVEASIVSAYQYVSAKNPAVVSTQFSEIIIALKEQLFNALQNGLNATTIIMPNTPNGRARIVPDTKTQLSAVREISAIFANIKPTKEGGGLAVNVNLGDRNTGKAATTGKLSFEALLDKVKTDRLEEDFVDVKAEVSHAGEFEVSG